MTYSFRWTEELTARVKSLYLSDVGPHAIALQIDTTPATVINLLTRLGLRSAKARVWTPERVEELTSLHAQGVPPLQIADQLGLPRGSIDDKVSRLGLNRIRLVERSGWTDEDYATARQLREAGVSFDDIAKKLGRTVYAIKSKLQGRVAEAMAPPTPPEDVLTERERLLDARARQCDIAHLMGDPPPGYSALDRMRSANP